MFKSYLGIALRNIRRNKGYSFINIFGLALSLGLGLLIIQMIVSFTSYDRFQANKDRIYRLNTTRSKGDEVKSFATAPYPLASALAAGTPGVEASTVLGSGIGGNGVCRGKVLPLGTKFADPGFFRVFSFRLDRGDPATALREPNSIVLTSEVAAMFFGKDDPMGEVIRLGKWGDYTVTGVLEDTSKLKTHMSIRPLISISTRLALEQKKLLTPLSEDRTDLGSFWSYVLLGPGVSPGEIENAANRLAGTRIGDRAYRYRFWLQGLTDIVNGPKLESGGESVPMALIYILYAIAFLVVLTAAFNYTNLSIARALSRAREVGIRKVVGAKKRQIFGQFVGEAVVIALLSLAGGFALYRFMFIPLLYSLHPVLRTYFPFRETWSTLASFLAFATGTGIVAGAIPALHISRFQPIRVLHNLAGVRVVSRITMRKALIVFQFALSVVFVISTLASLDQLRFVKSTPLGLRTDGVLTVPLEGMDFGILRQKVSGEPGVVAVSGAQSMPALSGNWTTRIARRDAPLAKPICSASGDSGYISVFGLHLLAGSNFPETPPAGDETPVLLNASAVRDLGYGEPQQAVGQTLVLGEGNKVRVAGVVEDFVHSRVIHPQGAFALRYRPEAFNLAVLRVEPDQIKNVVERLQRIWTSFDSAAPFTYAVFEDQLEDSLKGEETIMKSIRFVSLLAVFVSCLGLLGMADYSSRIRRREVGIRKVCGAGEWRLVALLSRSFLGMLGIAMAIAVPVAWWFGGVILSVYRGRIVALRPEIFAAGAGLVAALGMIVVLSQTIRAARTNPADVIRSE